MLILKDDQKKELESRELSEEDLRSQMERLKKGSSYVNLVRPAVLHDGITFISEKEESELISNFLEKSSLYDITKFIPASGAATRMFKSLANVRSMLENSGFNILTDMHKKISGEQSEDIYRFKIFLKGLYERKFAFSEELENLISIKGVTIEGLQGSKEFLELLKAVLDKEGLNFGNTPKALIKFHRYKDYAITPTEEHIMETCLYTEDSPNPPSLHFTISSGFNNRISSFLKIVKERFISSGLNFSSTLSFQKRSSDTISIDMEGNPVEDLNNHILFRPGGHGSLLFNLNDLEADIVFIKNIDNVTTKDRIKPTIKYKMIMGGKLIEIREKIFHYLRLLPKIKKESETINNIYCYSKDILNINFKNDFPDKSFNEKKEILMKKLNRPVRVCGMVENRGEPGGGPFWIKDSSGNVTLQIVESAQIDTGSDEQLRILKKAEYFNPVDIVCSITDYRGRKFHLPDFSDPDKYFVSEKYYNGKKIKVLEHPGLWNGSMDDWISVFIEIPLNTFNPVKYVNDLLDETHQPDKNTVFFEKFGFNPFNK